MPDTPTPQQALEALRGITLSNAADIERLRIVRAALESAAKEQADWEAIEQYCRAEHLHFILDCERGFEWSLVGAEPERKNPHARLEAISAAAEWCRKEVSRD